eukprot:5393047-Amphidinium_carterae.1
MQKQKKNIKTQLEAPSSTITQLHGQGLSWWIRMRPSPEEASFKLRCTALLRSKPRNVQPRVC